MKISTILDHIDSGHVALPEFQRGYVWNRDQVRALMDSLFRRHPVGSLLVWVAKSEGAPTRGDGQSPAGVVKLLLDGQQRITSLYGIMRGKAPPFFDGNKDAFVGLRFHLGTEEFSFFQPIKMKDDPLWVDVTKLMKEGHDGLGAYVAQLSSDPRFGSNVGQYVGRLSTILGIRDIELHIEEVSGADKNIDVVVEIFNKVNSGGTKLSKGDLALAKVCAEWTDARDAMKSAVARWREADFHFDLDWLLRCVNAVVTGKAKFNNLHDVTADQFRDGLARTEKAIDQILNVVAGRLGLDHDRVLFGGYAFPVMVRYLVERGGFTQDAKDRDKLLFWYLQNALWGRYSGSTETVLDRDLTLLDEGGGLDRLIEEVRVWRGGLRVEAAHFDGKSIGARFYPMLYLLTRTREAKDWGTGLPLKSGMLGRLSRLDVHHIFPKAVLYKTKKYGRGEVNAIANFCFLTQDTNLRIGSQPPDVYFPEIESRQPGALASQWIPMDSALWKVDAYRDFLEARRRLLAEAANGILDELWSLPLDKRAPSPHLGVAPRPFGGIESDEEERKLQKCNEWIVSQGLPEGVPAYELADEKGNPFAVLDLAWPKGLQEGFSQRVAVLLDEGPETIGAANAAGFRCFTEIKAFQQYVKLEILSAAPPA